MRESSKCHHLRFFSVRLAISSGKNAITSVLELYVLRQCAGSGSQGSRGARESHGATCILTQPPEVSREPPSVLRRTCCPSIWRLSGLLGGL